MMPFRVSPHRSEVGPFSWHGSLYAPMVSFEIACLLTPLRFLEEDGRAEPLLRRTLSMTSLHERSSRDPDPLREKRKPPVSSRQFFALSLGLSLGLFVVDALTPQRLVVSILQDVPIALTGLTLKRKFTVMIVLLGILSNILAEAINVHAEGAVSSIAIANRFFSVISFLLVGYLAMKIQDHALETGQALSDQKRAERDRKARALLEDLSRERDPDHLLGLIPARLRSLLAAQGVIVAECRDNRWTSLRFLDPPTLFFWEEGASLPGALALLLSRPFSACSLSKLSLAPILENNGITEGLLARLRTSDASTDTPSTLLLFVLDPRDPETSEILDEILPVFEELLRRLELLRSLQEKNAVLSRRNAMIRDLVTGVSHDIRTPLLAQNMNMALALDGAWGELPKEAVHLLDQMIQSNRSVLDLSSRLLLLSRYELNDLPLTLTRFSIKALLEEVFQEISPLLSQKALTLSAPLCNAFIEGDRTALKRLFLNLLDNAIKWSPIHETISLTCRQDHARIILTVSDRGPGIPVEMVPQLFQRFGGLQAGSGFGLGLYLAQQIARLHGGGISYHQGDPGCCFRVDLPERRMP